MIQDTLPQNRKGGDRRETRRDATSGLTDGLVAALLPPLGLPVHHLRSLRFELVLLDGVLLAAQAALLDAAEGEQGDPGGADAGDGAVDGGLGARGEFRPSLAQRLWWWLGELLLDRGVSPGITLAAQLG